MIAVARGIHLWFQIRHWRVACEDTDISIENFVSVSLHSAVAMLTDRSFSEIVGGESQQEERYGAHNIGCDCKEICLHRTVIETGNNLEKSLFMDVASDFNPSPAEGSC